MRSNLARVLALLALLPIGVLAIAACYQLGMAHLEGEPRSFGESVEWAAETLTTTGYGRDAEWHHPLMIAFVVGVQFAGVFMLFLVLSVFAVPYFESRFERRLPTTIPARLADYVLVYRYGSAVGSLLEDAERQQIPVVLLEEHEASARQLRDRGFCVVYARLGDEGFLREALSRARALVANGEDHDNAVLILAARQLGFTAPIYAVVENPLHRKPLTLVGANAAFSPKHALAAALAAKASDRISPHVAGLQQLGDSLEVSELRIQANSPVANLTLRNARIRERTGATIVAQWVGGEFVTQLTSDTLLRAGTIVVAVGSSESIDRLGQLAKPLDRIGHFIVAGYGEVGHKVVEMLRDAGEATFSLDIRQVRDVDLVADALDGEALEKAGIRKARTVILALASDSTNLFAATIARDLAPHITIIARVDRAEDVKRMHAAGADFALSLSQVAGQLLASRLFGEEFITLEPRMRIAKASSAGLVGLDPDSARVRERTGCSIVAVGRGDELILELDPSFQVREGDALYLCGTKDAVSRYFEVFPEGRTSTAA